MKANELRIANKALQVQDWELDEWEEINVGSYSIIDCENAPDEYKPIPLTEELLKRFGFEIKKGACGTSAEIRIGRVNSTDIEIISGRTTTMDTLTEIYALAEDYPVRVLDYGYQMTEADALIVFWDGKNEKTARTISLAEEHGHKVRIVKY